MQMTSDIQWRLPEPRTFTTTRTSTGTATLHDRAPVFEARKSSQKSLGCLVREFPRGVSEIFNRPARLPDFSKESRCQLRSYLTVLQCPFVHLNVASFLPNHFLIEILESVFLLNIFLHTSYAPEQLSCAFTKFERMHHNLDAHFQNQS